MLIVSAGEAAARDLLAEIVELCGSPLLAESVVDESASLVRLSNGSAMGVTEAWSAPLRVGGGPNRRTQARELAKLASPGRE